QYQPQMVYLKSFSQEPVLRLDQVMIPVAGKPRPQSVAGLCRPAVAEVVGDDYIETAGIQGLPLAKQLPGEGGVQQTFAVASCPVQNQHRVAHHPLGIAFRLAEAAVM